MNLGERSRSSRLGMTIVEVVLGVLMITVMAVLVLNYARLPGERVKTRACELHVNRLQTLIQQYRLDYGQFPSSNMSELAVDRYLGEAVPVCPIDGRPYYLERQSGQVLAHGH